jgi:UDP-N-acetylmuramoyl-tripeptide--D-alanyl-D-alanine ligase
MRSQVITAGSIRIINDCYNANPASMRAAIDLLVTLGARARTVAVLGDMLELGSATHVLHREIGAYLAKKDVTHLIVCGSLGRFIAEGACAMGMPVERVVQTVDAVEAGHAVSALVQAGDVVLVKASRGMKMEQVVAKLVSMHLPVEGKQAIGR